MNTAHASSIPDARPEPGARRFVSQAVERVIRKMRGRVADPELTTLFSNCYPNTLDTTVSFPSSRAPDEAFVITGDIDAMWLRDSTAQLYPYLPLVAEDASLRSMIAAVIRKQARCILSDPYANAFYDDPDKEGEWKNDGTAMRPGIHERKWEPDSLCAFVRLSHRYVECSGDAAVLDGEWLAAARLVVRTFKEQRRLDGTNPYRFTRSSDRASDSLQIDGEGYPGRPCGLIASGFRPSDDACLLPFNVPANAFAVVSLRQLAGLVADLDPSLAADARTLADSVDGAILAHGTILGIDGPYWAYEVDGFGNAYFMDDSNVPSLLALPYFGYCRMDDPVYLATRKKILGPENPFFFTGSAGEGTGGPHIGMGWIWPMSIIIRAMTTDDGAEINRCLSWLKTSHGGTGLMHESFWKDDPRRFTRSWFSWCNSLFGEMMIGLADRGFFSEARH